jgi:ribosomal protein S17E
MYSVKSLSGIVQTERQDILQHHQPAVKHIAEFEDVDGDHIQFNHNTAKMGRVRTKTVKKSAKVIIERYYPKLTLDFETNKRICDEIAIIASKRLRNKVCSLSRDRIPST